jgi:ubiquinone/menaquinone biosynthesis C-methylase UbiE
MSYTDHTNPDTVREYDRVAAEYDAHFDNSFDRAEENIIFKMMAPHLPMANVLDIGCGTGLLVKHFNKMLFRPKQYAGVDISKEMIRIAERQHPNYLFVCGDMVEYMDSLPENYFHTVVSGYCPMNYCDHSPDKVYRAVKRVLKPGGVFLNVMASSRYAARESHIVGANNMRRYFDPNNAMELCEPSLIGLRTISIRGVNYGIERYRKILQLCPESINEKLFKLDQHQGERSNSKPYLYLIHLQKD